MPKILILEKNSVLMRMLKEHVFPSQYIFMASSDKAEAINLGEK
ncbi:MAG: hypothetical protein QY305_05840 [Candidatus Brocadiaceae baterium WH-1]|nr:MAG: hypothetical protein QY305_05840 [Candidatus Jettenia sp. AMX2]